MARSVTGGAASVIPPGNLRRVAEPAPRLRQSWRPSLRRSVTAAARVPATSSPTRRASTPRSPRTRSASSSQYADLDGAAVPRRRRRPGLLPRRVHRSRGDLLSPSTRTSASCPGSATIADGHGDRVGACSCRSATASFDVCYSSNVLEHVPEPWRMADEMRPRHPARRHRLHLLHGLVRPVGRPRDRAVALPRRCATRAGATRASTATSPRTSTASRCSGSRSATGCAGRARRRRPTWWRCCRATTRGGPGGCCGCPSARGGDVEPRAGAPQAVTPVVPACALVAACLLLVGLAFVQAPGFLVPDTKFDLVDGDPGDFLGRALHLWDAEGAFGQLQNQAYGYLWPMGPFFARRQRWSTCPAGWSSGCGWAWSWRWPSPAPARWPARSASGPTSRAWSAGFAFALSPRMLTTLGPISIEAWPSALAPWVLLPLVDGSSAGSPRRAAALSGAGGRDGRRRQRRCDVRRHPARRRLAAHPHARAAPTRADALVAGVHRCSARCGGWCRCS